MAIPLFRVVHDEAIEAAVLDVLRSGQIASGRYVEPFRERLGRIIGNPRVVTLDSMSSAMTIALRLAGAGPGSEVITSPFACLSTNAPLGTAGVRAVWADVDPATGALDVADVARRITQRTRAVVLYHLAGYPGPARELAALCAERGVVLIEDCDNALGATVDGVPVGSHGDLAIYSFYPNRQIAAIEGGAIACRAQADFERAQLLRRFGIDVTRFRDPLGEIDAACDVPEIGWSAVFNNLGSAVGLAQLDGLAGRLAQTRANARRLMALLADVADVTPVRILPGADPVFWGLMVLSPRRDALLAALKGEGIGASKLHQRNDRYTGFGADAPQLPGIDAIAQQMLALPCGWWLSEAEVAQVADAVRRHAGRVQRACA